MKRLLWYLAWLGALLLVAMGWCDKVDSVVRLVNSVTATGTVAPSVTPLSAESPMPSPTPTWVATAVPHALAGPMAH